MYGLPDSIIIGTARRISRSVGPINSQMTGGGGGIGFSYAFSNVVLYRRELDTMLNNPQGDVGKYLRKRGLVIVAAAKRQVGVDTGRLRDSIKSIHLRDSRSQFLLIGSKEPHALMHHDGTKPHTIVPREAPMLRFTSGSRIIYTREVQHPGTRPNRYLSDQLYLVKI